MLKLIESEFCIVAFVSAGGYVCCRYSVRPPDAPLPVFGRHLSTTRSTTPSDGQRFPSKPPGHDADVQGMSSRLRQSSSKPPLLRHASPRPSHRGSPGEHSAPWLQLPAPGLDTQRGLSPSQEHWIRPKSSTEHPHGGSGQTSIRPANRYRPREPGIEMDRVQDDENEQEYQVFGSNRDNVAPPPVRFGANVRRPRMPPPRGMRPPSLLALDIEEPSCLRHQKPNPMHNDSSEPIVRSQVDEKYPSSSEEVKNLRLPPQFNQGNYRPPLQIRQDTERLLVHPEGQKFVSMQDSIRPPHMQEHVRQPVLPEGQKTIPMPDRPRPLHTQERMRPPLLPGQKSVSMPDSSRPPQMLDHIRQPVLPVGQAPPRFPDKSLSVQDSPRPPQAHMQERMRPPGLPEGFRPPRLHGARQPLLSQNIRPAHFNEDSQSSQHQTSLLPRQNFQRPPAFSKDNERPLSAHDQYVNPDHEPQVLSSRSDSEMQKYRGLRPPADLPPWISRQMHENTTGTRGLSESVSAPLEEQNQVPHPVKPRPPSLMDLNIPRLPQQPPVIPTSGPPNVRGISNPETASELGLDSRHPFAAEQGLISASSSRSVVGDDSCAPRNYNVGMSDEPLQFTGRMPPRSAEDSFQRNQPLHVHNSGLRPPFSSSIASPHGASTYPAGLSDEPLQFTGRIPGPSVQDLRPQQVHSSSLRPLFPAGSVTLQSGDSNQGVSSHPVGMSNEPLQFTGRMPVPRAHEPSSYHHLPNSFPSSQNLHSTAVSTAGQPLQQLPVHPPPGMHGMRPRQPQMGAGLPPTMPVPDSLTNTSTRPPLPIPPRTALHPPVDGSSAMPRALGRPMLLPPTSMPPPAMRPPFFPPVSMSIMVSCTCI